MRKTINMPAKHFDVVGEREILGKPFHFGSISRMNNKSAWPKPSRLSSLWYPSYDVTPAISTLL
jgi:hypothetical protein